MTRRVEVVDEATANDQLPVLIRKVEGGITASVTITRHNRPVAVLISAHTHAILLWAIGESDAEPAPPDFTPIYRQPREAP